MDLAEDMLIETDIIEISIDRDLLAAAAEIKAKQLPINNKSYMRGDRHLIGALGEILFQNYIKEFVLSNSFDSDIIVNNLRLDIKAKQRTWCNKEKLLMFAEHGYEGSVQAFSIAEIIKKNVDGYVFISISKNLDKAYIVGWIDKFSFIELARKIEPNTLDKSNNQLSPANNYNVYYKDLQPIKALVNNKYYG